MILVQAALAKTVGRHHDESVYRHVLGQVGIALTLRLAPACDSSYSASAHFMALRLLVLRLGAIGQAGTPKAFSGTYAGRGGKRDAGAMPSTALL